MMMDSNHQRSMPSMESNNTIKTPTDVSHKVPQQQPEPHPLMNGIDNHTNHDNHNNNNTDSSKMTNSNNDNNNNNDVFTMIQCTILDGIYSITQRLHPITIVQHIHVHYYTTDPLLTIGALLGGIIIVITPYGQSILLYMIQCLLSVLGRIVGTTIGVAFGLGFATHICNLFDAWEVRQQEQREYQQQQQQQRMMMKMMPYDEMLDATNTSVSKEHQRLIRRTNSMMMGPRRSRTSSSGSSVRTNSMVILPSSSQHQQQHPLPSTVQVVLPTINSQHDLMASSSTTTNHHNKNNNSILEDGQTYQSLMSSAGYHKPVFRNTSSTGMLLSSLRGQVIRHDQIPTQINYLFTSSSKQQQQAFDDVTQWTAVIAMNELWTEQIIPAPVQRALGKAIEFIVRDFIAMWYSKADVGCIYNPDGNNTTTETSRAMDFTRTMLYSVAVHRPLPFVDAIYQSCAIIFGNLATRVEQNVNVMELLLVKYTKILAHTFKWYRHLRKQVKLKQQLLLQTTTSRGNPQQQRPPPSSTITADHHSSTTTPSATNTAATSIKNSLSRRKVAQSMRRASGIRLMNDDATTIGNDDSNNNSNTPKSRAVYVPVSEIAMTKEFLVNGKLHKAVTFGLDIPSLLYSDTNGRGCGVPYQEQQSVVVDGVTTTKTVIRVMDRDDDEASDIVTDDDVLAARLYDTNILAECELDYNRVVGHRMVKALIPRSDFGSAIVQTLLTEIMAGCVLSPIMSLFAPDTISSWIVMGLSPTEAASGPAMPGGDFDALENERNSTDPLSESVPPGSSIEVVANELNGKHEFIYQEQSTDYSIELTRTEDEDIRSRAQPPPIRSTSGDLPDTVPPKQVDHVADESNVEEGLSDVLAISTQEDVATTESTSILNTGPSQGGMTSLLTMALIDLQQFMDFDDCRRGADGAPNTFYQSNVDWEGDACRAAIVRLVLVIEAALLHGRCTYKIKNDDTNENTELPDDLFNDDSELPVEVTLPEYESISLTQILMEMTGDIDAFEQRVASETILMREKIAEQYDNRIPLEYQPSATEISSLRTLIAAWLENGQIYRTVTLLVQAHTTILAPFYHKSAFLRSKDNANGFVRQLRSLENVMILVDTIAVLSSPRLDESNATSLFNLTPRSKSGVTSPRNSDESQVGDSAARIAAQLKATSSTPRYLDFHRNESLAASLCSERERRMQSWDRMVKDEMEGGLPVISRSRGNSKEDVALHKELHHIAMLFYFETVILSIRDAARRTSFDPENSSSSVVSSLDSDRVTPFSLLTIEAACPKRRLEIPDDDSSFLLRGQPRVLNAVGVHRDPRNHDHSYKSFAGSIEDVAKNEYYNGGRYIRRCLIRYYPSDRTAAVDLLDDARKLDQRKCSIPHTITLGNATPPTTPLLSDEFMNNRYLCQRWVPKGTTRSQSLLASGTMEGSDFTLVPRAGKAIEFVYRMSYYERPMVDLSGKHFTVYDSTSLGVHRADASALEISDASLSIALEIMAADSTSIQGQRQHVEFGKDGYPVVWLKSSRKQDDVHVEAKSYRISFLRAALLITSARHEAQLKCVISCIKAGSPSKATKILAESFLKPSLKLIEYAGSLSRKKQSVLLRDLKLGVNHIDIDQLRRNALLSPRYPTELLNLTAVVDDVVESADTKGVDIFGVSNTIFKLKCSATVTIVAPEEEMIDYESYKNENGLIAETYKEEWVVYRSLKEFQALHKHLKSQVSATESSGTAGSRLVGAATAAFAATTATIGRTRQRKMLIPSLSQASKAGALGVTKKIIFKRKEILDGYLGYILSPGHLLGRCSELLLFLGASFPLDPNVRVGQLILTPSSDLLGRKEMARSILQLRSELLPKVTQDDPTSLHQPMSSAASVDSHDDENLDEDMDGDLARKNDCKDDMNNIAVRNKIDKVRLPLVRTRIFELLRYQFGFENASFARNRLLAALKTASFAVTSASDFRKTLYKLHVEHLNSDAVAVFINMLTDILWPKGKFFESSVPQSPEEVQVQANKAKELLHESFPDQVRAILGSELTKDGLDIFYEMLQNRIVVKSMAYMLFDHLWLEVFPEIGDVLSCGAAIDFDTKDV